MSLQIIYESQLEVLLQQREFHIIDLEHINNQIFELRRQARKDGVVLREKHVVHLDSTIIPHS